MSITGFRIFTLRKSPWTSVYILIGPSRWVGGTPAVEMGWGNSTGKKEVINQAVGEPTVCGTDDEHAFAGKLVLIDVSGLAHKASKKDPRVVARDGVSEQQRDRSVSLLVEHIYATLCTVRGGRPDPLRRPFGRCEIQRPGAHFITLHEPRRRRAPKP